jgi:hypothetical protein
MTRLAKLTLSPMPRLQYVLVSWQDARMEMGIRAAQVKTRSGEQFIVVAVRSDVLRTKARRRGVLDVLTSIFPEHQVVLAASTSDGLQYSAELPEAAEKIRKTRSPLDWQRYSFAS